jgi:2-isopropylmalate synthase
MEVPPRQPYAGELVFTAFSGSHQDAINKGMTAQDSEPDALWQVPYLPLDPKDIGRTYEAIIRINSQSGKGGVAYVMDNEFGFQLPRAMRIEFGKIINTIADAKGAEISSKQILQAFEKEYLQHSGHLTLEAFSTQTTLDADGNEVVECSANILIDNTLHTIQACGNGPIDAFARALNQAEIANFKVLSYAEHSLSQGASAQAVAYIQIQMLSGQTFFGAGIETNIDIASIKAVLSALNRAQAKQRQVVYSSAGNVGERP